MLGFRVFSSALPKKKKSEFTTKGKIDFILPLYWCKVIVIHVEIENNC